MKAEQQAQVLKYLKKRFGNETVTASPRRVEDSIEIYMDDEFLGLLYIDDEDPNDISYNLDITILQQDLDEMDA